MDLADRRGAERHGVEVGEHPVERAPRRRPRSVASASPGGSGVAVSRHQPNGVDPLVGQQALGGGHELAELDVGRAARLHQLLHVLERPRAGLERAVLTRGGGRRRGCPAPRPGRAARPVRPTARSDDGRSDGRASSAASIATRSRAAGPHASHRRA